MIYIIKKAKVSFHKVESFLFIDNLNFITLKINKGIPIKYLFHKRFGSWNNL